MINDVLMEEVVFDKVMKLLEEKKFSEIKTIFSDLNEVDIASILEEIDSKENIVLVFKLLPKCVAAEVFANVSSDIQKSIIEAFSDKESGNILNNLFIDDAVDFLEEMPANLVERLLNNANKETRDTINKILSYPDSSAGSIMTTEFLDFKKKLTVKQAFERIRRIGGDKETINVGYVTSSKRTLEGIVSIRDLLLADPDEIIENIMETNVVSAQTHDDKEDVADRLSKYSLNALPVVDKENRLVGIVTFDDVINVLREEATEDIQKMAAITPTEKEYLKTSPWKLAKSRIVWLIVLMFSSIITGALIEKYEAAFVVMPILVVFIPMLMDTGGNCGSQTSTMIIRGMALNEIRLKDFFKVFLKEFLVSLIVGGILSALSFVRVIIQYQNVALALVLSLTLFLTVVISKFLGFVLPLLAKRFKMDPAVMSSPLITTVVDAASVLIYFVFATLILGL